MMRVSLLLFSAILFVQCSSQTEKSDNLVWSDEFEGNGNFSSEKWNVITGDGCPELCGFGNNEEQYYTALSNNIKKQDGKLVITALKDSKHKFTSAKLTSENIGDWKYGYIEVRAKLPQGVGSWPAIWMLPTLEKNLEWPLDGEIDIMEHVGYNQGMIYGTIHTEKYNHVKGTQKSDSINIDDAHNVFHNYSINWTDEKIEWFVDDQLYNTVYKNGEDQEGWPFDKEFHLIINLAVGGNWGGRQGIDEQSFPQTFEIDYVRVYKEMPIDKIAAK